MKSEGLKFLLALVAPVGSTLMGLVLGIQGLFIGGLVFTGLILVAGVLRRMSLPGGGTQSRIVRCSGCRKKMLIISNMILSRETMMSSQAGFRCAACGLCTCYECSDNRKPCKKGHQQWKQLTYVPYSSDLRVAQADYIRFGRFGE